MGTGIERIVAVDSGVTASAVRPGVVDSVDSSRIVVRVDAKAVNDKNGAVDIYNLIKFNRSNTTPVSISSRLSMSATE